MASSRVCLSAVATMLLAGSGQGFMSPRWCPTRGPAGQEATHPRRGSMLLPGGRTLLSQAPGQGGGPAGQEDTEALIRAMITAAPYDLPNLVSGSLKTVSSPTFFMKIAELSDLAVTDEERDSLSELADNVMKTLEIIVERTQDKVDTSSTVLQEIVSAAAEEDGEFLVPLANEKREALREAIQERMELVDEGFFSTVNAWMRKSEDSGLDGMITILQKVLQSWAAVSLTSDATMKMDSEPKSASDLLDQLLADDPDRWTAALQYRLGLPEVPCTSEGLLAEVQARIESVVFNQESGSYAQRVQAEFLRELTERINTLSSENGDDGESNVDSQIVNE